MSINYEYYKVFYHVAKELSFSKAAKALYISQSAVSQSISALEKELDTRLFIRSTKRVNLTKEGQNLLSHIEPAIHSILLGEKRIKDAVRLEGGQLHIGVSDTICKYYLIQFLKTFHHQHPKVELLITNDTSIACVQLLKENKVDLILTNLPNKEISNDLHVIETAEFNDIIIAPSSFKELTKDNISLQDLINYPILLLDQASSTTQYLMHLFNSEGLSLKPAIELGNIDLLVELTKIGLGISFIPEYVYKDDPSIIKVNLNVPLQKRKLGIVTQAKTPNSKSADAFIHLITDNTPFQQLY